MSSIDQLLNDPAKLDDVTRAVFEAIDTDKSGSIDRDELKVAMETIADEANITPPSEDDVDHLLTTLDIDKSGSVDVDEFRHFIEEVLRGLR
mmetsp:Transcript_15693/g.28631  ORF Transcript_15693/g.28631 Transcript_15693/m.28631 type:complete len:92 (+) Transcript_15693:1364-1639(+)